MSKIKILHILNSLCVGGTESIVISICNDLDKILFDVTLLVLSNNNTGLKHKISKDVHLIELDIIKNDYNIKDIIRLFIHNDKLAKTLRELRPDIINTHTMFFTALPIFISIRIALPRTKHIYTKHSSPFGLTNNHNITFRNKIEILGHKIAPNTTLCVSNEVERGVNLKYKGQDTVVIPNYIDTNKFQGQIKNLPTNGESVKIVYIARISKGKNHQTLLHALSIVVKVYPTVELYLVGDGDLTFRLESLVQDLGLENNVKFLGFRQDVPKILKSCDLGVFPSESEGFGLGVIEMMSSGLPLICSDIPVLRDFSQTSDDILYHSTHNSEELSNRIIKLISNPILFRQMSSQSLEIAKTYSKDSAMTQYSQLYQHLVK